MPTERDEQAVLLHARQEQIRATRESRVRVLGREVGLQMGCGRVTLQYAPTTYLQTVTYESVRRAIGRPIDSAFYNNGGVVKQSYEAQSI